MKTKVIRVNPQEPEEKDIKKAAEIIRQGGLVVIPTETVYGIAANMLNESAIQRLCTVKQRLEGKPFSLHIASKEEAEIYARDILPSAYRLMKRFWPGPITLVLKSKENGKIGLRMPNHKVALSIIKEAALPVVCPSANLSGNSAPSTAQDAIKDLDGLVDLVVDAGRTPLARESTVVDATGFPIQIIREGALTIDEIENTANKKTILFICTGNSCRSVMAKWLLEEKLKEKNRDDVQVWSAGIMMLDGLEATAETKELLRREGMDVSGHRSQQITEELIKQSDIILIMERLHEERILQMVPEVKNRVFLLKEFAKIDDGELDIADPIGKPLELYERIFSIIKEAIERIGNII